ncbi:MAG: glycosyltransferase [Planctomycetia bacterium]|nr:glycosyltransferase [Planctomycetia bacterium]
MPSTTGDRLCVALVTPWNDVCGNSEYAHRLAEGLAPAVEIVPVRLVPHPYPPGHFEILRDRIAVSQADVVHIQHEYGFFGREPAAANRSLLEFVSGIDKPIVITLHTVIEDLLWRMTLSSPVATTAFRRLERAGQHWGGAAGRKALGWLADFARRYDVLCRALERVRTIVVHTQTSADLLADCFPRVQGKIRVVPIPIAARPVAPVCRLEKRVDDVWLMMTGFVMEFKQHRLALAALRCLPENYRLVIAGGPQPHFRSSREYWRELIRHVHLTGLTDRVTITGFIADRNEYLSVLDQADVFLMPYREVGQSASASLADILCFEKPIITSAAVSLCEYRDDAETWATTVTGHVDDPQQFAAEIQKLHGQCQDPEAVFKMHIRNAVRRYSMEKIAAMYRQIYETERGR